MNYIGQTKTLILRIDSHISESKIGILTCNFPRHVFDCAKTNKNLKEPFFKVYAFTNYRIQVYQ